MADSSPSLSLGYLSTPMDAALACVVARALEANGMGVDFADLPLEGRLPALEAGEVDLLVSCLVPEEADLAAAGDVLGTLFPPQVSFATLPGTFPATPEQWRGGDFNRLVVTERTRSLLPALVNKAPDLAPLPVEEVASPDLAAQIAGWARANQQGADIRPLVLAWEPNAAFEPSSPDVPEGERAPGLRTLPARPGLDLPVGQGVLLARPGLRATLNPDLLAELGELRLDNRAMSVFDRTVGLEDKDPDDMAEALQRGHLIGR
ncbi:hypothetical protein E3E12_00205 [Formicincola oecophyllae]|uniref:ABC-type glycine betaine transport system substrate-binding domain-containing protein n=1 Tax=Formicincola oecophyllae TaxID=2558361 RepID=A0A4Y6U8W1_9PROT|nr:hypothetical protein [Formicincola oecophyllae]QDH12887.1 hypothetical protein E3E12_00205 [Formicincola oecophyllae]